MILCDKEIRILERRLRKIYNEINGKNNLSFSYEKIDYLSSTLKDIIDWLAVLDEKQKIKKIK